MHKTKHVTALLTACCLLLVGVFAACKQEEPPLVAQTQESAATVSETESELVTTETTVSEMLTTESETTEKSSPKVTTPRETTTRKKPSATITTTPATTLPPLSAVPQALFGGWIYYEKIPPQLLFNGGFLEGLDFHMDWEIAVICLYYEDGNYSEIVYSCNAETYVEELTNARVRQAERENGVPLTEAQKEQLAQETEKMLWDMEDAEEQKGTFTANDTTIFYTVRGQRYTETYKLLDEEMTVTASSLSNFGLPRTMYRYNK